MKFLTLADWTGMVETELFASIYRSYGLATVRYPILEITARAGQSDNGRGFSLRVVRAGRPRRRYEGINEVSAQSYVTLSSPDGTMKSVEQAQHQKESHMSNSKDNQPTCVHIASSRNSFTRQWQH